jgi:hypothetical protein
VDPGLRAGDTSHVPGPIGDAQAAVALAGVASSRFFMVEGERVAAAGGERRGVASVSVDGVAVAGNLITDAGTAANVVVTPGLVRRELVGTGGSVLETILALPALPMLAVEWAWASGAPPPGRILVAFTLLPGVRDVRYRVGGASAIAMEEDASEDRVHVVVHPKPEEWTAMPAAGGGVAVQGAVAPAERVTLLIAAGDGTTVTRALRAAPHLAAHAIRAAGDADRGGAGLSVSSGVGDIDRAVTWATARLRGALRRSARRSSASVDPIDGWFWTALGAAASGDDEACTAAWAGIGGVDPRGELELLPGLTVAAAAPIALAAGRLALVTGDASPALEVSGRLGLEGLEETRRTTDEPAWTIWRLALRTLADALRDAAPESRIRALRALAAAPAGRGTALRLPMIGDGRSPPAGAAQLIDRLLGGAGGVPGPTASDGPLQRALTAWDLLATERADEGWRAWRAELAAGLDGIEGRGLWDPVGPEATPSAPVTGVLLSALGTGLLGASPDAPSRRLVLSPRLPAHLRAFRAEEIRVGDARLILDFRREGGTRRYELEPTAGRTPALVVLEPTVYGAVAAIRVDGHPAELDVVPVGEATRVRVQLQLGVSRVLEIDEVGPA